MKVWIVMYDYLDNTGGRFRGVFSSKEKAEDYIDGFGSNSFAYDIFEWTIDDEEWDLPKMEKKSNIKL